MMGQGIVLMVAGMGIVFAFLYVLIAVSKWTSALVSRFEYLVPDDKPKKPSQRNNWKKSGYRNHWKKSDRRNH